MLLTRRCSSSGRAPPCQGGGSEFEPRHLLQTNDNRSKELLLLSIGRHSQVVRQSSAKAPPPVRIWVSPPKRSTSRWLVFLFGYLGIVQCSGEVNSLCAKGWRQRRKTAGRRRSAAPPCGAPGCARYLCYFDVPQQTNPNLMPIGDGFNS